MMTAASVGLVLSVAAFASKSIAQELATMDPARRTELVRLVRQDCGSCHGLTLQGGLGPALLPETLKDKPVENLKFVIMQGRPGTAMPPWKRFLTEAEAQWIVENLQKGFPSEH
ncbi:MAG: cytochrome c [Rhodoferax sp.]|jgi:cytochrome c55X|nr:cytochrome c [Rhodoferax sp.]MBP9060503.1 cytochrome c [Rhodoferax sp.]MBP9683217.1 cytochrome c [Rhodoferax sp.]